MEKKRKLVVGMASIWAGGGHNALRDFLVLELDHEPELELHQFTHSDASYNMFNDVFFGRFPTLYDAIYRSFPNEYPAISALKLVQECEEFVKKVNPDLIISTNFGVLSAFGLIKRTLKLNFINIFAIPDYGRTASVAFPSHHYFKPDFVIVFDEDTRTGLVEDQKYPAEKVILSGYTANRNFRDMVKKFRKKTHTELIAEINKETGLQLDPDKKTILVAGGAGGIIDKSYGLLKKIVAHQEVESGFKDNNQFLIITGQNTGFLDKINDKRKNNEWSNIIPVPWIGHEIYLKLQLVSAYPILITIAPATINELLESHCGPFLIQHCRKGQEQANVDFAVRNKFAYYVPNSKNMLQWIVSGFSTDEKEDFDKRADDYRDTRLKRLSSLPQEIVKIYNETVDPKRSTDTKRLNFSINWALINPKILVTIFMLVIPSSMIFAYAQYYKGKHKIMDNKYLAAFFRLHSKTLAVLVKRTIMYTLYVLECTGGKLYTGITNDLENRLATHRAGKGSRYVRAHLPIKVVYKEELSDRSTASKREQEIKSWSRSKKIKELGITFQ